jgi:hypothetical protein
MMSAIKCDQELAGNRINDTMRYAIATISEAMRCQSANTLQSNLESLFNVLIPRLHSVYSLESLGDLSEAAISFSDQ